jgi:hypothetical protein
LHVDGRNASMLKRIGKFALNGFDGTLGTWLT